MNKTLNIFFAISKSYIQHFTVAATSLLENNRDLDLKISIIHDHVNPAEFKIIIDFFKNKYDIDLQFINIGTIDFSVFRLTPYYPKYTYFRLFMADISPADIETALFLDSDIVVTGSIKELAEIDMSQQYIYAVSEVSVDDNVSRLSKVGCPLKSYFNAGVILVNLKTWRKEKLSEKFIAIARQHADKLEWVDQDILNIYFANQWKSLDKKFNAIHLIKTLPVLPVIVHYASYSKPWFYLDTHPYNYLYQKYLRLTPFRNVKQEGFSLKNFILKNGRLLKRKLREAKILKYNT